MILVPLALVVVVIAVVAVTGVASLLRERRHGDDEPGDRLFGDSLTTAVVVGGVGLLVVVIALAVFVLGVGIARD